MPHRSAGSPKPRPALGDDDRTRGSTAQLKVTLAAAAGGTQTPGLYRIEPVEALPWEIATVLGAAVLEMRKLERAGPVWPVTFDGTAAQALKEADFRYQNFDLSAVAVTRYQRAFSGAMDLSAILTFVDGGGRRGDRLRCSVLSDFRGRHPSPVR